MFLMNTSPASLLIIHLLSADDQAEVGYVLQASSMGNATDGSAVMDRFVLIFAVILAVLSSLHM